MNATANAAPAWLGNTLGLEDKVLPPWTPLETAGGEAPELACWGRRYLFRDSVLPSQIMALEKPLLSRPAEVSVSAAGRPIRWERTKVRLLSAGATAAEIRAEAWAAMEKGIARLAASIRAEYDGLLLCELTLDAPDRGRIEDIRIEIPLRADAVLYRHRVAPGIGSLSGNLPAGEGVVEQATFIPFVWLGDNDKGLFWFCESAEHWPNAEAPDAFQTERRKDEVILRLHLLAKGQSLPQHWRYQFGLQATPVKPMDKKWRHWRLTPAPRATLHVLWPRPKPYSELHYGYPQAADDRQFQEHIDEYRRQGARICAYVCPGFMSGSAPEFKQYRVSWDMGGGDGACEDVAAYSEYFHRVCPNAPGISDFLAAKISEFMDRFNLDGTYHDNTAPHACWMPREGCGYIKDGKVVARHHILAYRALYRRIYALTKACRRPTFNMAHMSSNMLIPVIAYEDAYLDGEHLGTLLKSHDDYVDVLALDAFRTEFMGRQWGVAPYFLPALHHTKHSREALEPNRGLAALLAVHDVAPWCLWCNLAVFAEMFAALDAFGYLDAEFLPYFGANPPAATTMADVYVSAYRLPDRALILAANLSRQDRAGTIQLRPEGLGMRAANVVSWPDKTPANRQGADLRADIPRQGYKLWVVS
jgi:hypothetical protein